jgi:predicted phosphodiesterase
MRVAIISDIHGNMDAFKQVLIDINNNHIHEVICLGDNIGYGPEPEKVIQVFLKKGIPTVMGNHEMACIDPSMLKRFNPAACESLKKTIQMLSKESLKFIAGLKKALIFNGCRFVHGFPPDSATIYLFQVSSQHIFRTMSQMNERICFIGHTHELGIIEFDGEKCLPGALGKGIIGLKSQNRYLINVGSVGQPRDGDNRAKYVIWDTEKDLLEVRFVPYDIEKVVQKILAAGLPEAHANRLW